MSTNPNLWRGVVAADYYKRAEHCVYVSAPTYETAKAKIAAVIAVVYPWRAPSEVAEAIYNVEHAAELVERGASDDHELRLFEVGWGSDGILFDRWPIFATEDAARLARAWASTPVRP